ncbi:MAG: hypothetical protein KW788_05020 [Candidatus Doudnabacteria bacterium]|nr:hypothetical protein [Candidatus Doudnabacteria bacterium]
MILPFHIVVAVSSLIWTAVTYFYPSQTKLNAAYTLTALMLVSGFALILSKPAHMTQTCIEGLVFLGVVSYGLVSARHKLARVLNE